MYRAWMVLLAGCAFQSSATTQVDALPDDAMLDSPGPDPRICWTITGSFHVSACATTLVDHIDVTVNTTIDTDGNANPPGFTCAVLAAGGEPVCALAANTIRIAAGKTLSAHGTKPLALLGHAIDIEGTIDVASHLDGQRGPASNVTGCNPGTAATNSGGGGGGGFTSAGGKGGDEGASPMATGGAVGNTISFTGLRGGCDGGRGGDSTATGGPPGVGGAGGGVVWIASDTSALVIGSGARINASGASGVHGTGSAAADQGGFGGGSGGMIVLQAPTIMLDGSAQIFANGGHGGGGAEAGQSGHDGTDPSGPSSGGGGGGGGTVGVVVGNGGSGYPSLALLLNGTDGAIPTHGGGGGGGGGAGAIRVASGTTIGGGNVSPPPLQLTQ